MTPSLDSWILAARPPTLWAAVAPVLVGSALAARAEVFRTDAAVVALVAAVLIQIGVNFANDVNRNPRECFLDFNLCKKYSSLIGDHKWNAYSSST